MCCPRSLQKPSVCPSTTRDPVPRRHDRNGVIALLAASPAFGKTHAGVLGIGKATVRHDGVPVAMFPAHGLFGGEIPLVGGALHQHHAPRYVSGGEDVRNAGPEGVVHKHVAATPRLHSHGLQIQSLRFQASRPRT